MSNTPIVSVVTPTYQAERTVARCIDSVRSQRYQPIEHVVVDGGSKDATLAILVERGVRFVSERDAGIYDAMSKGVRLATGEYIHILNADDAYADTESLARIVAHMQREGLDLCHGLAAQVDASGRVVRTFGRHAPKHVLMRKMRIAHPTVVVRREIYQRYGAFSIGFRIAGDHEFILRIWDRIKIGFLPEVLVHMEIGGMSTSNENVVRSYRESMAAAILHGANPILAAARCWYEIVKHKTIFARKYRSAESA
jgi:glycosyltransferase involved in cell wall biosynthesis